MMDLWRALRTDLRIRTYWFGRRPELYVFVHFTPDVLCLFTSVVLSESEKC